MHDLTLSRTSNLSSPLIRYYLLYALHIWQTCHSFKIYVIWSVDIILQQSALGICDTYINSLAVIPQKEFHRLSHSVPWHLGASIAARGYFIKYLYKYVYRSKTLIVSLCHTYSRICWWCLMHSTKHSLRHSSLLFSKCSHSSSHLSSNFLEIIPSATNSATANLKYVSIQD